MRTSNIYGTDYYDRDGKPLNSEDGRKAWETGSYEDFLEKRAIGKTRWNSPLQDPPVDTQVSTVFLGMDHAFSDDAPPLIFETLCPDPEKPDEVEDVYARYSTEQEARDAHARLVVLFTALHGPPTEDWRTTRVLPADRPRPLSPLE